MFLIKDLPRGSLQGSFSFPPMAVVHGDRLTFTLDCHFLENGTVSHIDCVNGVLIARREGQVVARRPLLRGEISEAGFEGGEGPPD